MLPLRCYRASCVVVILFITLHVGAGLLPPTKTHSFSRRLLQDVYKRQIENDAVTNHTEKTNKLQQSVQHQTKQGTSSAYGTNTHQNPETNANAACASLEERIPWSQASREERMAFVRAQHCLTQIDGIWTGDRHTSHSAHEDFVLLHYAIFPSIHGTASLLVAHRLFVLTYFRLMQRKCGYTGRALYFDFWTYADQGTLYSTTDMWTDDYYGTWDSGNRNGGTFGLFDDYRVHYVTEAVFYDKFHYVNRPLQRHLKYTIGSSNEPYLPYMKSDYVRQLLAIKGYNNFRYALEKTVHQYLHGFFGGDVIPSTSTNTPYFWQIHLAVDALYSAWQEMDGGDQRFLYGGPRADNSSATVSDTCVMLNTWSKDYNVEDMLDTRTKPNCYEYVFPDNLQLQ